MEGRMLLKFVQRDFANQLYIKMYLILSFKQQSNLFLNKYHNFFLSPVENTTLRMQQLDIICLGILE